MQECDGLEVKTCGLKNEIFNDLEGVLISEKAKTTLLKNGRLPIKLKKNNKQLMLYPDKIMVNKNSKKIINIS
eukprot:UN25925